MPESTSDRPEIHSGSQDLGRRVMAQGVQMRRDSEPGGHITVSLGHGIGRVGLAVVEVRQSAEHEQVFIERRADRLDSFSDPFLMLAPECHSALFNTYPQPAAVRGCSRPTGCPGSTGDAEFDSSAVHRSPNNSPVELGNPSTRQALYTILK